jgi:cell division protease FtsH
MPEMEPNQGEQGPRWARLSRSLAFWALVIMVPLIIIQMLGSGRDDAQKLGYTDFIRELEQGNVVKVVIIDGKKIEGELRAPVGTSSDAGTDFWTMVPVRDSEDLLKRLEASGVTIEAEPARVSWWTVLVQALPWLLIIGLMLFWLRQMQASGARAFSFGKSKAKLLSGDTPKLTFADVAGCEEAKQELQETIEFLKEPSKFTRLGGRLPKGALLVGPPGTGKTLLAKAVAGEASRPFFSMSGSDFVEMFVGVGASRVRDLFEQGKAHAPCIIFIDELDAVGRHRGAGLGGGHDEREQTLNQLLVEMDGFESNEGVILIAATNRPDVLDPALLRPGRFDRQIVVDAPDVKGREGILRVHTRKIPLADDVDLAKLAKATPGMSGADLANMVNEGALLAARRDKDRVDMEDLEESKDRVLLGAERRSMVISEEERRLTAYHEAGHAVAAYHTPECDPLHKVTIVPRGRALGLTFSMPEDDRHNYSKQYLIAQLVYAFGGRVAEELVFGPDKITTGAGNDIERATALARRMITEWGMSEAVGPMNVGDRGDEIFLGREIVERRDVSEQLAQKVDEEVRNLLDDAHQNASRVLKENLEKLHVLAEVLLERETLDSDEIITVFEGRELPPLPEEEPAKVDGRGGAATDADAEEGGAARDEIAEKLEPAAKLESAQGETTKPETSR